MRLRLHSAVVAILATTCVFAGQASAQIVATPRAPQGLFGGVRPTSDTQTRLDLSASLVEGYDEDLPTQFQQSLDPTNIQAGGFWTMLSGTADYARNGKRAQLVAHAASNVRHYPKLNETRNLGHAGGLGVTVQLPARMTLFVNQAAASSPTYLYDLFPSGPVQPGRTPTTAPDYSVSTFESYAYSTTAAVRHDFSTRARFTVTGDYTYTDRIEENATWQDLSSHAVRGEYSQNVTRNTALNAQYRYRSGDFGYASDAKSIEHGLDFGMDFNRPLSPTRRALFNFKFGTSMADVPEIAAGGPVVRRQYLTVGEAGFGYDLARTWQARANFKRGLEYVVDLPHPVFADSFSVSLAGLLGRRVDLLASAGYSSGESLLSRDTLRYDTYTGNLRLRYAITRSVATYIDYLYYYYDFRGSLQLLAGMPPGLERNGIRAAITLWVPALRR